MEIEASPPHLPKSMLRSLFRAFGMLDEPIDLAQFPTTAMNATKCLFDVDFCWYAEIDTAMMRASAVFDSSLAHSSSLIDAWPGHMLEEPTLSHWKWSKPGFVMAISDFDLTNFHRTGIYENHLHPLGIEHSLIAPILWTSNRIISIGCGREDHDFSVEDRFVLMLLSSHLSTCRRLCEAHSIARAHQPLVHDDLAVTQVELVVVDRDGRVRSMSSRAAEFIRDHREHVGEFPRCSPRLPARLDTHVADTARGVGGARSSLQFPDLEIFTTNDGDAVSLYLCHREQLSFETLARAMGTTPRRAEIGRYLCRGKTREEIAKELGISSGTVRKHLEDLYKSLGATREVEAVNEIRRRVADYLRRRGDG